MVGFKGLCPGFKTSSLKWDHNSFVEMNQHPNLTPEQETNCRRYHKLSCARGLVEKIEPKPRVSPLPPCVGWWAVPWGSSAKARGWAGLYRPTYPWQLGSNSESSPPQPAAPKPLTRVKNLPGTDSRMVQDTGLKPFTPGTPVSCSPVFCPGCLL